MTDMIHSISKQMLTSVESVRWRVLVAVGKLVFLERKLIFKQPGFGFGLPIARENNDEMINRGDG